MFGRFDDAYFYSTKQVSLGFHNLLVFIIISYIKFNQHGLHYTFYCITVQAKSDYTT